MIHWAVLPHDGPNHLWCGVEVDTHTHSTQAHTHGGRTRRARSGREVCCVFKKEPVFIFHLVITAHCKLPYACCLALASCRRPSPPSMRGAPVDTWPYRRYYRRVSANSGGLKQYQGSRGQVYGTSLALRPGGGVGWVQTLLLNPQRMYRHHKVA